MAKSMAPSGFDTLKTRLREKKTDGVFLFYGGESYLRDLYFDKLVQTHLGHKPTGMELTKMENEQFSLDALCDALETVGFGVEKTALWLREIALPELPQEQYARLVAALQDTAPGQLVILTFGAAFLAVDDPDKRRSRQKLLQGLPGLAVDFVRRRPEELEAWAEKELAVKGKRIDSRALHLLIERCGCDMHRIKGELDKLLASGAAIIRVEDVDAGAARTIETDVFALTEAVGRGEFGSAFRQLNDCRELGEKPIKLLFLIAGSLKEMLLVRAALNDGMTDTDAIAAAMKVPANRKFLIDRYKRATRQNDTEYLKACALLAAEADMQMKRSGTDPWTILERMLFAMMEKRGLLNV